MDALDSILCTNTIMSFMNFDQTFHSSIIISKQVFHSYRREKHSKSKRLECHWYWFCFDCWNYWPCSGMKWQSFPGEDKYSNFGHCPSPSVLQSYIKKRETGESELNKTIDSRKYYRMLCLMILKISMVPGSMVIWSITLWRVLPDLKHLV